MTPGHKLVLLLIMAVTLVLASPTSNPSTGKLLARASGGTYLTCASHASNSAIAVSQSNIAMFASSHSDKPKQIRVYWYASRFSFVLHNTNPVYRHVVYHDESRQSFTGSRCTPY